MSAELDALTAQVKVNSDTIDSAITIINSIPARIADASADPATLAALTAGLKAKDDALTSAVMAIGAPPQA